MATFWGHRKPGEKFQRMENEWTDEVALVFAEVPDWVKIPEHTPHSDAGKAFRVKDSFVRSCLCEVKHDSRFLTLRGSSIVIVECRYTGWMVCTSMPKEKLFVGYNKGT
tara:strand:+ start:1446 stop:1772 length:327 start_codon:yes stop_codon:yes gene_type:complete